MSIDWSSFVALSENREHFLLTTHVRPDGDGLGSMIALAEMLRAQEKTVSMMIGSKFPPRYDFLDPEKYIQQFAEPGEQFKSADLAIVMDTGTWNQLGNMGPFLKSLSIPKVVIDHHVTQDDIGTLALVDTSAEATARLSFEAIQALGGPLTEKAANALFVGLAMDTGWFRHSNVTPGTFGLAEELVSKGARPTELYQMLYEQSSPARMKLIGLVLARMTLLCDGQLAYTELHRDDYAATGATPQDSEDLVDYTRTITGVEVGVFFMEQPRGGVKISFRSRSRVDVSQIAEQFGGGGHKRASGTILEASLEDAREQVLSAIQKALTE